MDDFGAPMLMQQGDDVLPEQAPSWLFLYSSSSYARLPAFNRIGEEEQPSDPGWELAVNTDLTDIVSAFIHLKGVGV